MAVETEGEATAYLNVGKRALDIVIVLLLLPIALPAMALIALAILLTQGRPIFYRATRVTARGDDFSIIKFRTMVRDSAEVLETLRMTEPLVDEEFAQSVKLRNDPRVTRLGAVLRRTSLDELPQLFNILGGEMTLVGPRPVTHQEWDVLYGDQARFIFRSKPGLTGFWQVSGRSLLPYAERIELDKAYAQDCRLTTDISILMRTIPTVLRGHGAY